MKLKVADSATWLGWSVRYSVHVSPVDGTAHGEPTVGQLRYSILSRLVDLLEDDTDAREALWDPSDEVIEEDGDNDDPVSPSLSTPDARMLAGILRVMLDKS